MNWLRTAGVEDVALRKESVDRNKVAEAEFFCIGVALRKESVDRNCDLEPIRNAEAVALRKESVDRNQKFALCFLLVKSRSPQGERG